ncbi:mucin-2-like [Battus philenor]|uniref:mucin-2-like n=1 Tax=Battus philenor TaxID=42288 RepID=UPI0035CF77AB
MSPLWIVLTLLPILGGAERFNCRGRILGAYYADAKSGCKAFHVCVRVAGGGIRDFRFFCPPGTLFHQEAQTCTDWGDDDPLACPADIYDGFDTKKLSQTNRDDEAEFGLQRAETGDHRLSQNNGGNGGASDLRAAHSSDFFSGQRDRGRDDSVQPAPQVQHPVSQSASQSRQSFRRPTTPRPTPRSTSYTPQNTPAATSIPYPSKGNRYDQAPKRKIARKRPVYTTTQSPSTVPPNTLSSQIYSEQPKIFNRRIPTQNTQSNAPESFVQPAHKEEYVEVSRVTPKSNKYFSKIPSPTPFTQQTTEQSVKNGLAELYNSEAQSTPGFNGQNENRAFKLRNSFSVVPDVAKENDFLRSQSYKGNNDKTTSNREDFSTVTRNYITTTHATTFRNVNSISYEQEKNNYNQFLSSKQSYYNNPTTTTLPTTTYTTTTRYEPSQSLNTIAYNTNNAFNAQASNFADSGEDDGQYRPPEGEDDGQYRPELYERELLSGAHSLNIAASGNRLIENQKEKSKNEISSKSLPKTSPPRPFRPAPTPTSTTHSSRIAEITYPTTTRLVPENTQRTFDYYQTYTTTSRPYESSGPGSSIGAYQTAPPRITSTSQPRTYEPQRKQNSETAPSAIPSTTTPKTNHRPHHFEKLTNKDDTSYDYAYYDSDPGFSEYDHIEEFGKTNTKA